MERKFDLSILAIMACLMAWFFSIRTSNRVEQDIIQHDVIQYYSYLPAYFIHHDLALNFLDTMKFDPNAGGRYWHMDTPEGKHVFKMSMGVSMLYAPFFFIGHYSTLQTNHFPADGFSTHYKSWLAVGTFVYAFLGLLLMRYFLLQYFEKLVTAITLLCIGLGTNLFCYVTHDILMSHAYSFFLFACILVGIRSWYLKPGWWNSIWIGLCLGLISLIRPTNSIVILMFAFYSIYTFSDCKERLAIWIKNWYWIIVMGAFAMLVWYPQLMYWKQQTGQYFYYSYGEERIFWNNPHWTEVLFSYRNGWLVYTPVMFLAVVGILLVGKFAKAWRLVLWLYLPLQIYIISCWWCWWYGSSFGQRPMVDIYPLMAIPLASFIAIVLNANYWVKYSLTFLLIFFIQLNIFQTWQFSRAILHFDSMTSKAYWRLMFQANWPSDYSELIEAPDYENAKKGLPERHPVKD